MKTALNAFALIFSQLVFTQNHLTQLSGQITHMIARGPDFQIGLMISTGF